MAIAKALRLHGGAGIAPRITPEVVGPLKHTPFANRFASRAPLVDTCQDGKRGGASDTIIGVLNVKSDDKTLKDKPGTLGDGDISSQRVSRRSLLTTLGLGAGVAAATVAGATGAGAHHRSRGSDPGGYGSHCGRWHTGRSDQDGGRYADREGYGGPNNCTDGD